MSEETAGCILSVLADNSGVHAAVVSLDGELLARESRPVTSRHFGPFQAVEANQFLLCLAEALQALGPILQEVRALGLTTPRNTSLLIGEENQHLTPVLFGRGNKLAAASVPAEFRTSGPATVLYRQAIKRQLESIDVDAVLSSRRFASLGALLHHALSGYWVDCAANPPTGVPWDHGRQEYAEDPLQWLAIGFEKRFCPLLVPPGGIAAQVAPQRAARFGLSPGTPIVATADDLACLSYGLKSNGSAWVVRLGRGLRATWTGPEPDTSYTIQIREPEETLDDLDETSVIDVSGDVDRPPRHQSVDLNTLSHAMFARLEDRLDRRPGPRAGTCTFELNLAEAPLLHRPTEVTRKQDFTLFSEATLMKLPAGADGLRYLPGRHNATLLGIRSGHTPRHIALSILEGLCLELARWRERAAFTTGDPMRIVLEEPWAIDVAHVVSNLVCEPLLVWEHESVNPILLGQALAILRDLRLETGASPSVSLTAIEPRVTAATEYESHRVLHAALMDELTMVLE